MDSERTVLPLRLLRLANPVVRALLGSPAHGLLSRRLLVLEYRGRRSGRTHRIPLLYAAGAGGSLVVVALGAPAKLWWRSFDHGGVDAAVLLRGRRLAVRGRLTVGAERERAWQAYVARHRRAARRLGDAAVVVLEPRG
jgi:hypothetical protein